MTPRCFWSLHSLGKVNQPGRPENQLSESSVCLQEEHLPIRLPWEAVQALRPGCCHRFLGQLSPATRKDIALEAGALGPSDGSITDSITSPVKHRAALALLLFSSYVLRFPLVRPGGLSCVGTTGNSSRAGWGSATHSVLRDNKEKAQPVRR